MTRDCSDLHDRLTRVEGKVERLDRLESKVDGLTDATARIEEKLTTVIDRTADQETRMRRLQRWAWGLPTGLVAAAAAAIAGWKS